MKITVAGANDTRDLARVDGCDTRVTAPSTAAHTLRLRKPTIILFLFVTDTDFVIFPASRNSLLPDTFPILHYRNALIKQSWGEDRGGERSLNDSRQKRDARYRGGRLVPVHVAFSEDHPAACTHATRVCPRAWTAPGPRYLYSHCPPNLAPITQS